jgi:hypothetical protein
MRTLRLLGLGVRLAIVGGRAAVIRLALMSFGLALGVTMLLGALSVSPALRAYDLRANARNGVGGAARPSGRDVTLRWWLGTRFEGRPVTVMAVEPVGDAPLPPGLPRFPGPGEVFVSPALASILRGPDGLLLRPRVPGRILGAIGTPGLLEPNELVAYLGASPRLHLPSPWVEAVKSFSPRPSSAGPVDVTAIVLLCTAVAAVLLPVGLFVLTATRLSASTREARFAAVRLAGATQRQVRLLAATESGVAALVAAVAGVPLFLFLRPVGIAILSRVAGHGFFVRDFWPPVPAALVVDVVVPIFAVAVAALSMRRMVVSPLGIARRSMLKRRGWHWSVVFLAGLSALLVCAVERRPLLRLGSPIPGVIIGAALVIVLIGLAGTAQWIGWRVAAAIARLRPSPAILVGARRLEAEPTSAARVVMSIAVLVALAAVGEAIFLSGGPSENEVRLERSSMRPNDVEVRSYLKGDRRADVYRSVAEVSGVRSIELTRYLPTGGVCSKDCVAIAHTDGRQETVELIRNVVRWDGEVATRPELASVRTGSDDRMMELFELALILVLVVTAANLLVSTVDGMMERRRSLAVLSAIGVGPGTLRRSVLVQVALPLAAALALGVPAGMAVTKLLFRIADEPVTLPLRAMLLTAAATGAMVLLVTAAAFPWVRIVRRPELLRTE